MCGAEPGASNYTELVDLRVTDISRHLFYRGGATQVSAGPALDWVPCHTQLPADNRGGSGCYLVHKAPIGRMVSVSP